MPVGGKIDFFFDVKTRFLKDTAPLFKIGQKNNFVFFRTKNFFFGPIFFFWPILNSGAEPFKKRVLTSEKKYSNFFFPTGIGGGPKNNLAESGCPKKYFLVRFFFLANFE